MIFVQKFILSIPLVLALVTGVPSAVAQAGDRPEESKFSETAVRKDVRYLYETLQSAHFDLYVHRSKEEYDRYYKEQLSSINGPMKRVDVVKLFMALAACGKIGHARVDFPVSDYLAYMQSGGTIVPFDIRVEDSRAFITYNYSGNSALAPGAELVALNGRTIADWIESVSRYVSAERPYMSNAQLETWFPRYLWLDSGKIDSFKVTVRSSEGTETTLTVDAVPVMDSEKPKGSRERLSHSRKAELLPDGIAYFRPGPFYAADKDESLESFETFLDDAFRRFIAAGAKDLIIDLRNNPGGDNSFSDPMIAWFADKPFSFASRYEVKTSAQTLEVLQKLAEKDSDGISAQMLEAMKKRKDGEAFAFEIPKVSPRKRRFSGRVWALVNRHSYSNATTVAAIIRDYGFGTILGEETSDLPSSYASSAKFTLPETGIVVTYPKGYFVRPNGDETLCGVIPDHPIDFPIVPGEEDRVLEKVSEYISSQRSKSDD